MKAMIHLILALTPTASAILLSAPLAFAQEQGQQTKFEFVGESMEQLLNNGYEIKTTAMGQFILDKPGRPNQSLNWIICSLGVTEGQMEHPKAQKSTTSTCFTLN